MIGMRHFSLLTIRAYVVVVVILNVPSQFSGILCYRGYSRLLCGRGFEGRAAVQQRGRKRELGAVLIQIFRLSLFSHNSRLQL